MWGPESTVDSVPGGGYTSCPLPHVPSFALYPASSVTLDILLNLSEPKCLRQGTEVTTDLHRFPVAADLVPQTGAHVGLRQER